MEVYALSSQFVLLARCAVLFTIAQARFVSFPRALHTFNFPQLLFFSDSLSLGIFNGYMVESLNIKLEWVNGINQN